jgi:hypothetical protein
MNHTGRLSLIALGLCAILASSFSFASAQTKVILNGSFTNDCAHWTYTDASPAGSSAPLACGSGWADWHLTGYGAAGHLDQSFAPVRPRVFSFIFGSNNDLGFMALPALVWVKTAGATR